MNSPLEVILAELRSRLAANYGNRLDSVILYGSRARRDAEPDSDVDVMIVLREPADNRDAERERYMAIAAELSLKHNIVIMPFLTDARTYAASGLPLYRNIRREGVAL